MNTVQEIEEVLRERPEIMALLELAKDITPGEQYMLICFLRHEVSFEELEAYFHEVEAMKIAQVLGTDKAFLDFVKKTSELDQDKKKAVTRFFHDEITAEEMQTILRE